MPRREDCRVCGGQSLVRFLDLGESPLANRFLHAEQREEAEPHFPLDVYFCSDCTQVQLGEVVPPEILFRDYIYVTGTSATMPLHFGGLAERVTSRFFQGKDTPFIVEAGSNDGTLLSAFLRQGARVLGVDPATNIARLARERGVDTVNEFFGEATAKKIQQERGNADVIVGCNVFAHVDDLSDFVRGVKALLAPGGVFVVEVPYLFDLLDKLEFDTIYHEHLSYFSVTALDHLFTRHGLSLFDIEYYPIHGGTIRCYAQHQNGPHQEKDRLKYLEKEEILGVRKQSMYLDFASKVEALRHSLVELLKSLRAKGYRVAGYGSPAKGNTLLNYMKIDSSLLDFLVDKNPMKHNLYSPGMKLPVLPVEQLLARKPEYTLILAWNFAEEIISQQQEYLRSGGHFIIPIPEPKIISVGL
jgi:SAM-dependent methyltransferase